MVVNAYIIDAVRRMVRMRMSFDERLGSHFKRVEQELQAAKSAAVKPAGLTVPQYAALFVLDEQPGISAAELARRCAVTPQTMTTILRNLEAGGLIERTPHPLHKHVIETRPTHAGRKALDQADKRATGVERRLAAAFSEEEAETLRSLLARVSETLTTDPILKG
ncbi:DNA-binding MarR family transcriptional regulator [Kribbella pratensis]|jgi:DNA-binding MarR family transcriptional regulator|uniref:DNA-binding MarR family transcriptional regulator n=2 Tax=Kribbellaceae TaxID=2726069 RepID=A0A4R8BJF5_9ACTN|nr:DNA-binding MarR family transcriptional regulator [Kribbella pratensis]